jgi:hypothetical protein
MRTIDEFALNKHKGANVANSLMHTYYFILSYPIY